MPQALRPPLLKYSNGDWPMFIQNAVAIMLPVYTCNIPSNALKSAQREFRSDYSARAAGLWRAF